MTYDGYLSYGGNEIVNSERARGYAQTAACPMFWLKDPPCTTLAFAAGDANYSYIDIENSPWYDSTVDEISRRFYGVYGLDIGGVEDSTRSADVTESIDDGGVIGRSRNSTRRIKVKVLLLGRGQDAVEYGMSWLSAQLDVDACGQLSQDCGTAEMSMFSTCPPSRGVVIDTEGERPQTEEEYTASIDLTRRFMRRAGTISGPLKTAERESSGFWMYEVQFVLAGGPAILGVTRSLALGPSTPVVIQDVPYNLLPYPSAELQGALVDVQVNYATNPNVEVNDTGWSAQATVISGTSPAAFFTSGRSTDIGAGGSLSSFRGRILGNNGSTAVAAARSLMINAQEVALPAGSGRRITLNQWAAALILNGTSPGTLINSLLVSYEFFNGAVSLGAPVAFGTATPADFGGKAYSLAGLAVPATATKVVIRTVADVTWTSSATGGQNSDIRLYSDALMVSVP